MITRKSQAKKKRRTRSVKQRRTRSVKKRRTRSVKKRRTRSVKKRRTRSAKQRRTRSAKQRGSASTNTKCEIKWKTLKHNGVMFQDKYLPKNVPIIYTDSNGNKNEIILPPDAEEASFFYARVCMIKDQKYTKNKVFNKNFWNDFKKLLPKGTMIKNFSGISFKKFIDYLQKQKDLQKNISRSRKRYEKEVREKNQSMFRVAYLDGKPQDVGNFVIEPPSIFLGRGNHPKMGMIKSRIHPEDITINIGKGEDIPKTAPGHSWGHIIHDKCKEWLASWKDPISGSTKYVYLSVTGDLKSQSDEAKFNLARDLKHNFIDNIRKEYMNTIDSIGVGHTSDKQRQLAVALYLIDTLLLRVGNEKSSDEADTVGVTSLRVEHIKLGEKSAPYKIELDFLGKDSVRYHKKIEVPKNVYLCLESFENGKKKGDSIFNLITPKDVNSYLKNFMPELTAKVFRTMNASSIYQNAVSSIKIKKDEKIPVIVSKINKANADVAIACNHTKKVSTTFNENIRKSNEQINKVQKSIKEKTDELNEAKRKNMVRKSRTIGLKLKKERDKLKVLKVKLDTKKTMKDIATGTSKLNYIDPRITVAFSKKQNVPLDKLFNKQQIKKFDWAENVKSNWKF